jgi:hypothetical protein
MKSIIFYLAFSVFAVQGAENIRINKVVGEKEELLFNILKLAMSKIDPDTQFIEQPEELSIGRVVSGVEDQTLDVMWAGASPENEKRLRTVRIPVLKGLLGHRIFIIRAADQNRFDKIKTFADLQKFKAGQGTLWGDTTVLKNAQIPVVTTLKYPNLFPMLEGERFDYFPRAIHEPWVEVKSHADLNLVVEKNVMLIYPFALYFYVNKSNTELHNKIYQGFEKAIEDGSYNEFFFNHQMIKDAIEAAELNKRTVIRINNTDMHPDTPYDRKEFWLDVSKL